MFIVLSVIFYLIFDDCDFCLIFIQCSYIAHEATIAKTLLNEIGYQQKEHVCSFFNSLLWLFAC